MIKLKTVALFIFTLFMYNNLLSQQRVLYKQVDTSKLYIETFMPDNFDQGQKYPAIVFFFGGGWVSDNKNQFEQHAKYFSKRGLVCFLADYRTKNSSNTTPFESLKDAKSVIRYIRSHHSTFNIDPDKIIASGGSAGGHLAAATALIDGFNENTDDLSISCKPNALVLFNPVIDNGPGGYGYERIGEQYKSFSPIHNIKKGAPPTIIFLGTKDDLVPVQTAEYYKVVMEKVGSRCDLKLYKDQTHGFFNYAKLENYKQTIMETDMFLQSLGLLKEMH
jgi:acetyl esterase